MSSLPISRLSPITAGRFALAAGWFCAVAALCAQPGSGEDPLSIVRIVIPPERVAKELEKVSQGTLTLQPLDEFETRVKQARSLLANREQKPRLRGAHYRAELVGHQLINGSGQWHVHHPVADAALLPIDPLSLALHKLKWERGSDAAFAEFDGKSLSLLVPGEDYRTCFFDWSMRGTLTQDGIQFPLAVPPCASCEFELLLPAEYWLSVAKSPALVTGPIESESPAKRLWRIQASGLAQFTITLRQIADTGTLGVAAPTLFARVQATQTVEPRRISVDQEFHIDIVHGSVQELSLEGDPRLQPFEVTFKGGQLKRWQWREGTVAVMDAKGKSTKEIPGILMLQFEQPMYGKLETLRVRSIAAAPMGESWSSPALRLAGAFSRGETLTVRLHAILPAARWNPGSFDVTHVAADTDGTQIITLVETAANAGASRRPTVLFHANPVDLTTDSRSRWNLADNSAILETEIRCVASRGNFFELRALLPKTNPAYVLEHVGVQPEGMMRGWYTTGDTLVVELKQPLTPMRDVTLSARLRSKFSANTGASRVLAHPEIDMINATRLTGRLDVFVADSAHAQLVSSSLPQTVSAVEAERDLMPSYSFHWRNQRLMATIRITPKPGQIGVRGEHRISLQSAFSPVRFRWEIEPLAGSPHHVDFRLSSRFPVEWRIGGDEGKSPIHHVEKLPMAEALPHLLALGAVNPIGHLATYATIPAGPVWRFHFSEPLREKTTFTVETSIASAKAEDREPAAPRPLPDRRVWDVPAMAPLGAARVSQEFAIESGDEVIQRIDSAAGVPREGGTATTPFGIRLRDIDAPQPHPTPWRVWTERTPVTRSRIEICEEAKCLTKIYRDGRVYHQLSFRLRGHRLPTCELRLPEAMRVVAVRVQDRWLNHFRAQHDADSVRLTLPCEESATRYVIVAQSPPPSFFVPGMKRVSLPKIGWPVAPIDVDMRLAIEEGITPIFPDEREPVGTPRGLHSNAEWLRRTHAAWTWGDSWLPSSSSGSAADQIESARRAALLAEAHLHAEPGETASLGALLETYALVELKEKMPLLIDRLAFTELGLEPRTPVDPKLLRAPIDRPFWETLGLIAVATPNGLLLTTSQRMHQLSVTGPAQVERLSPAMREAILTGRDASGGFFLITAWLNRAAADADPQTQSPGWHGPDDSALPMREWKTPLIANGGAITLLDQTVANSLGWLLALLWLFAIYATRNRLSARTRVRTHIILFTGMVIAIALASTAVAETMLFPSALSHAIGLLAALVAAARSRSAASGDAPAPKLSISAAGTVAATLLLGVITWQCYAQPPAPAPSYTVWIIQNPKPAVLLPAELSARLEAIGKQSSFTSQPTVLLSARYVGQVVDNRARFEVDYEVLSLRPNANFVMPLTGVQLEEGSLLDGTPAFPSPNKNGYALAIGKPGVHHVRLAFTTPIDSAGGMQGVRFSVPKAARCDLRMQWDLPVQNPQLARGLGETKIITGLPSAVRGWQAQVGYENDIHVRWTGGPTVLLAKSIDVSEAHYWDLRHGSIALSSQLHYRLGGLSLGQIAVAMPAGLQILSIEAHTVVVAGTLSLPIAVKHWQVQGKAVQRRLLVDFAKPVSGDVILRIEALPTDFTTQRMMLNLPAPMQGKSIEGWLGYRLEATESRGAAQNLAIQSMTTDDFQQNWQRLGGAKSVEATRAYRFQRKALIAGLELFVQPRELKARCDFRWDIDSIGADLLATCTLTSTVGDIYFAEFQVDPAIVLAGVRGPDVHRWHLHETLLQVWLKQPKKQTTIEIIGWQAYAGKADKKAHAVPPIHPLHAQLLDSAIELRPTAGLELDVVNQRSLRRIAALPHRFAITAWPWELAYQIRRQKNVSSATAHAKVERDERGIVWSEELRIRSDHGVLPTLLIKASNLPVDGVKFDVLGGVVTAMPAKKVGETMWRIQFSDGLPASVIVALTTRLPNDGTRPALLPTIEVSGVEVVRSTVAWKDGDLFESGTRKVITGTRLKTDGAGSGAGSVPLAIWKVAPTRAAMEFGAQPISTTATVRVLAFSETISRTAAGDWMHEASCWLRSTQVADVRLRLPQPLESLYVSIDGTTQPSAAGDDNSRIFTMRLSEQPQHLMMRWRYQVGAEKPSAPNTEPLQFGDAPLPTAGRVLILPPGVDLRDRPQEHDAILLHTLLRNAETEIRLLEEVPSLASAPGGFALQQIAERQPRIVRLLRQASYVNSITNVARSNHDSAEVQERISGMKKRNADFAKRNGWDKQRVQIEKSAALASCAVPQFEVSRLGSFIAVHPGQSTIALVSQAEIALRQRWTVVEIALLVALLLLVLSCFPQTYRLLGPAAPELAIVVMVIAIALLGSGVLPIALTMIPIGIRIVWTIQIARDRFLAAPKRVKSADQASTRTLPPTVN